MTATRYLTDGTHPTLYGHDALHVEIERTRQRCADLYDRYRCADLDSYADAEAAWRTCSTRHDALIEAGAIFSLGITED